MARITLNLDEKTANGGGEFPILPVGWYNVEILEVEDKASGSVKNNGKPMYNYKVEILDGDSAGRKLFINACLWAEAIFTQRDIQKALGLWEAGDTSFEVAEIEELEGQKLQVFVSTKDKFFKPDVPEEERYEVDPVTGEKVHIKDNEVKKYRAIGGAAGKPAAKKTAKAGFKL